LKSLIQELSRGSAQSALTFNAALSAMSIMLRETALDDPAFKSLEETVILRCCSREKNKKEPA